MCPKSVGMLLTSIKQIKADQGIPKSCSLRDCETTGQQIRRSEKKLGVKVQLFSSKMSVLHWKAVVWVFFPASTITLQV